MQLAAALSNPTNGSILNPETNVTTARARAKQLPLPIGYRELPEASGRSLATGILVLSRHLPSAYQGSSPRKYQFSQKVDSDIGAAPSSPTVLAFHTKQFPTLATEPVRGSKQSSSFPSAPPSVVPTLGRYTQLHRDNVWPPQQIVSQSPFNMEEIVNKPDCQEPDTSQSSPHWVLDGKLQESH
jgi:hypothetical protein